MARFNRAPMNFFFLIIYFGIRRLVAPGRVLGAISRTVLVMTRLYYVADTEFYERSTDCPGSVRAPVPKRCENGMLDGIWTVWVLFLDCLVAKMCDWFGFEFVFFFVWVTQFDWFYVYVLQINVIN